MLEQVEAFRQEPPRPHFEIEQELFASNVPIIPILSDLQEMNLLSLPYPAISMTFPLEATEDDGFRQFGWMDANYAGIRIENGGLVVKTNANSLIRTFEGGRHRGFIFNTDLSLCMDPNDGRCWSWGAKVIEGSNVARQNRARAVAILVCTLAAGNAVKETITNERVVRGKASESKFKSILGTIYISKTRLSLPKNLPIDEDHPGDGIHVRPHLRRGFINTFHIGPGRRETMKKWIKPVFVNADQGYLDSLPNYKLVA